MDLDAEATRPLPEAGRTFEDANGELAGGLVQSVARVGETFPRINVDIARRPQFHLEVGLLCHRLREMGPEHVQKVNEVIQISNHIEARPPLDESTVFLLEA